MQPYNGTNPFTPNGTPSGYGIWPIPLALTTDVLSAANLMAAVQAVINRANWLGHRAIDIVSGGDYTFSALVRLRNQLRFRGEVRFEEGNNGSVKFEVPATVRNGQKLSLGDSGSDGFLEVTAGSGVTVLPDGSVKADGSNAVIEAVNGANISAKSGSSIRVGQAGAGSTNATTKLLQYGPHVRSGDHAYTELRVKDLPTTGSGTIDFREADVWVVPSGMAAGRTAAFDLTVSGDYEVTIVQGVSAAQGHDYVVGGVRFAATAAGYGGSVTFIRRGASVHIKALVDGTQPYSASPSAVRTVWID